MLEKQQIDALKGMACTFTAFRLRQCKRLSPVQVNEEAEEVIAQLYHGLLHVRLELTPVMNLSGVKHAHVSHRDLYAPEGRGEKLLHHLRFLDTQEPLMSGGSLVWFKYKNVTS